MWKCIIFGIDESDSICQATLSRTVTMEDSLASLRAVDRFASYSAEDSLRDVDSLRAVVSLASHRDSDSLANDRAVDSLTSVRDVNGLVRDSLANDRAVESLTSVGDSLASVRDVDGLASYRDVGSLTDEESLASFSLPSHCLSDTNLNYSLVNNNTKCSLGEINNLNNRSLGEVNNLASLGNPYAVIEASPSNVVIPKHDDGVTMSCFTKSEAAQTQEVIVSPMDHDYIFGSWEPGMTIKFNNIINNNNNKAEYSLNNCNKSVGARSSVNECYFML